MLLITRFLTTRVAAIIIVRKSTTLDGFDDRFHNSWENERLIINRCRSCFTIKFLIVSPYDDNTRIRRNADHNRNIMRLFTFENITIVRFQYSTAEVARCVHGNYT